MSQIPPVSGNFSIPPSSDPNWVQELQELQREFASLAANYEHNPDLINKEKVMQKAEQLEKFIEKYKHQIEKLCKKNGWPAHLASGGGYEDLLSGIQASIHTLLFDQPGKKINVVPMQMINEDASNLLSMLSRKHS